MNLYADVSNTEGRTLTKFIMFIDSDREVFVRNLVHDESILLAAHGL